MPSHQQGLRVQARQHERGDTGGDRVLRDGSLERCDIVKYGGFKATTTDARDTLENARGLVRSTIEAPAASPAPEANEAGEPPPPPPAESEVA